MKRLATPAIGVLLGAGLLAQDAQEGRFRTSVDTVSIYATVNDADGRLVPDLTKDDFTVLDNGAAARDHASSRATRNPSPSSSCST